MTPSDILRRYLESQQLGQDDWDEISAPTASLENDPLLIKDSRLWLNTLHSHRHDVITIVGDYDADGILASSVMHRGLDILGIGSKINVYVPTRLDGYGISETSVDKVQAQFPDTQTVITVDNGISAEAGVAKAIGLGWTVLVTDHHLALNKTLNKATATVDINRQDDTYPFKHISGTAMAFKMLQAYARVVQPDKLDEINTLRLRVGISTITDMMVLRHENRYWVRYAIEAVQNYVNNKHGADDDFHIRILTDVLVANKGIWGGKVDADTFGFSIGPILNSSSRVTGTPELAYRFFESHDVDEATALAQELIDMNAKRKQIIGLESDKAKKRVDTALSEKKGMASYIQTVPLASGFVGLVAGSLSRAYNAPSIVFSTVDFDGHELSGTDVIHGSARSPEGLSIVAILARIDELSPELLVTYGGHAGAGGVAIVADDLNTFRDYFNQAVSEIAKESTFTPVDNNIVVDVHDVTPELINALNYMAPYGMGFPKPMFVIKDVPKNVTKMGTNKQHIKFGARPDFEIIDWNGAERYDEHQSEVLTCQGHLGFGTTFRGQTPIQMIVDDWLV